MKIFYIITTLLISNLVSAKTISYMMNIENNISECKIRIIESIPENQKIIGDYLFFIGFGDRADNHAPLFNEINKVGFRVISFDYPSHGLTKCGSLNKENYTTLSQMAEEIEEKTRLDINRPLIVSGWSTGGLLALRMLQNNYLSSRVIKGLILITPGIGVYKLVGGDGIIRNETLLANLNPPHMGDPKPISPLLTPLFSSALIMNGVLARNAGLPGHKTLMFIAGEKKDMYAKTNILKEFSLEEKSKGSKLTTIECPQSMHEMDNEFEPIGNIVRTNIAKFISSEGNFRPIVNNFCQAK